MAVKKNLQRVMISIPKPQLNWLKEFSKKQGLTMSKYISYILAKKAEELILVLKIKDAQGAWQTQEELEELLRIIKTPWIDQ